MNGIKLNKQFKTTLKRVENGTTTGNDFKTIIRFQLKDFIPEDSEPFNEVELSLILGYMIENN